MTTATLEYVETPFTKELVKQMRAIDTYDTYEGMSDGDLLDPFILTPERKREIPIVGDPDEITMARVKAFYNALATTIETHCGLMAVPVIKTTHEGFGRAFILVGKLLVFDKTLRDLHRFGFPSFDKLNSQSTRFVETALSTIEKHPDAAKA